MTDKLQKKTILLVEDDEKDELLIMRAFRKVNLANQTVVVRDGEEALAYLFAQGPFAHLDVADVPAVVLLDLNLPKISGTDVLRRIRAEERLRAMPVVVLTSSDEEKDLVRCYQLGANSYVRKPIEFDDFSQSLGQLGLYWVMLNESSK